jgi:hypothetical protein
VSSKTIYYDGMKVEIISEDYNGCMVGKDWQGFFFDVRQDKTKYGFRWQYIFGKPDGVTDSMVTEAVQNWKLKKSLSSKANDTFGNLIDEL